MNPTAGLIRSLLGVLRQAGHDAEADRFEQEFDARAWQVEVTDQLRVLERLQVLSTQPRRAPTSPATETPQPPQPATSAVPSPVALPEPPENLRLHHALAPWVATLPNDWRFVLAVHDLLAAPALPTIVDALVRIFVDHLGYEPSPIDETHRVATQRTLTQVRAVARHQDFFVMAVASNYAGWHTSSFEPVFQLHPRCIVFALEVGGRIRGVTRRVGEGSSKLIGQRIVRGRGLRAFPDDDLFVWAKRLAELEPGNRDDGRALAQRADDVVRQPAHAIVGDWPSAPVDPRAIPGPPWEDAPVDAVRRFLQADGEPRILFGLEAELRSTFPWRTRDGSVELQCQGYRVLEVGSDALQAEARAETLSAVIELDMTLVVRTEVGSISTSDFRLPAAIAIPDEQGIFVIRGSRFAFVPGLHDPTPPESPDDPSALDLDDDDDDDDGDEIGDLDDESSEGEEPVAPEPDVDVEDLDAPADIYAGEGLVPLLRWAVGRNLRGFAARFSKARVERIDTPARVRAWFGSHCDARSRLQLTARSTLLRYLEPVELDHLRTLVVDEVSPPPAWACLELGRELEPGRAYPVSGARLGPGGVLVAPWRDPDGRLRLHAGAPPVLHAHPRSSPTDATISAPWIASPLLPFAGLQLGRLASPLAVARRGVACRAEIFDDRSAASTLRIAPADLPGIRERARWTFDLPRHPGVHRAPEPLVRPGDRVVTGDPVVRYDHPWADAPAAEHNLVGIGRRIANRRLTGADQEERPMLRCPPWSRGRVDAIDIVPVVDVRGTVTRYRVTLDTSQRLRPTHAVLEDGRCVELEICGPEELPWHRDDGRTASALISSDAEPDPESDEEVQWFDGPTGDAIDGRASMQTIFVLPGPVVRPPDPCLAFRVLDGSGLPRSPKDPAITVQVLRQLVAGQPEHAEALQSVMRDVHGQAPSAVSVFELCRACRVPPPAFVPRDWTSHEPADEQATYDPVRTGIHRCGGAPYREDHGPWQWACDCEHLRGSKYAQVTCSHCATTVKRRWVGMPRAVIALPFAILHPWRKHLVGALLGLDRDEFASITKQHDCSPLVEPTRAAFEAPTRSLVTRSERSSDENEKVRLGAELRVLEHAVAGGLKFDDLWLTEVDVLSPRLLLDGYRSGAPDLLASPLTSAYRRVQGLAGVRIGTNETLRRAVWVELQRSVDQLFGDFEGATVPGTLADLWRRIWPTTAPGALRVSVPGLFEHCDAVDLRRSTVAQLLASSLPSTDTTWELGLLTAEGVWPLPLPKPVSVDPTDGAAWRERAAWARCTGPLLVHLAAMCLGIDARPSIVAALGALPGASMLSGEGIIGPLVLRELLSRMRPPEGRPRALLDLIEASEPVTLRRDRGDAVEKLERRLALAIPGDAIGAVLVRGALARVLCGFWRGKPSASAPEKWIWSDHAPDVPDGFRRIVPSTSSRAWRLWPGYDLMTNPIAAALAGWPIDTTDGYGPWFGLAGRDLLPADELTSSTVQQEVAVPTVPVPVSPLPREPDVRVLTMTLGRWIRQTEGRPDHVDR